MQRAWQIISKDLVSTASSTVMRDVHVVNLSFPMASRRLGVWRFFSLRCRQLLKTLLLHSLQWSKYISGRFLYQVMDDLTVFFKALRHKMFLI